MNLTPSETPQELKFLDEPIFQEMLNKLIASKGQLEGTGLILQDIRNMIYTRRLKVDPNVEGAVAATKKTKSTNKAKVEGFAIDDLLG